MLSGPACHLPVHRCPDPLMKPDAGTAGTGRYCLEGRGAGSLVTSSDTSSVQTEEPEQVDRITFQ